MAELEQEVGALDQPVFTTLEVAEGIVTVERAQDVEPILDHCKALQGSGFDTTPMGDKLAANIPFVLVERYCNDRGITFADFMANNEHVRAMVNDPALAHFRVWRGRV